VAKAAISCHDLQCVDQCFERLKPERWNRFGRIAIMQIQDLIQELSAANDLHLDFFSVVPALFIIIQLPQALDWQLEQYANLILRDPIKDILVTEKLPKDLANDVLTPIKANL